MRLLPCILGCISNRTRLHASRDGNYCLLPFDSQMVQRLVKLNFLEEIGGVKTARREAESILLAKALLRNKTVRVKDEKRMLKLVEKNKVLLRAADLLHLPSEAVDVARKDVSEAF